MKIGIWRTIGRHDAAGLILFSGRTSSALRSAAAGRASSAAGSPSSPARAPGGSASSGSGGPSTGTSTIRTRTTSATIDHAHERPAVVVEPLEDVREEVLDRAERVGERDHVLTPLPSSRGRNSVLVARVVDAAVAPRVAAEQPPAGDDPAADEPELPERVERVLRAARVVLARARRRQQAERVPPGVDEADAEPPHACTLPSTSRTCSTSQSWPRVATASARPGRAART